MPGKSVRLLTGIALYILLGAIVVPAHAMEEVAGEAAEQTAEQQSLASEHQTVDEITAYGRRTLLSFRMEMESAENDYYELFNALNDDDDYDVICKEYAPVGSRIERRQCKSRFEWESISEADRDRIQMGLMPRGINPAVIAKRMKVLDKMEELANTNPQLRESLFELTRISMRFAAEKERRCAGRIICESPVDPDDE